jgi:hypothetical protein
LATLKNIRLKNIQGMPKFLTIRERTSFIQGQDIAGRKMTMGNSASFKK